VVALSVSDTGIGIDQEQQERIFEAFAQGDGSTARLYGGTGLGLSISRELVGLLGGQLTVTSTPGEGSTFTVYLPGDLSTTAAAPIPASALLETSPRADRGTNGGPAEGGIGGLKILVVDDDVRNTFSMTVLLERGDAEVTVAESGAEALAALERTPEIDVVLMDIMMPVMDGYDTIRAIRQIDRFTTLPIIAVTGKATAGERERCIDAGANDHVPKPVDTAELLQALQRCVPIAAARAIPASVVTEPLVISYTARPERGREESAIDGLRILLVDDDFRNIFSLSALLERGHADVTVAESGAEGIAALERMPDMDIVLMDILMPVMDGNDTIRAIRLIDRFKSLPIIAVTAKATAGERQRCIDAAPTTTFRSRSMAASSWQLFDPGFRLCAARCMSTALRLAEPLDTDADAVRTRAAVPVLVVDDNPGKRLAIKAVLAPLGYSVVEADSGLAAMRCVMAQGLRRDPARCPDARHGRVPDSGSHSPAPAVRDDADHLHHGVWKRRDHNTDLYAEGAVDFIFAPCRRPSSGQGLAFASLFTQAEGLAARAREVQASADQLRLLTDAAPIGIFQTDAEDKYVYTNPRWTELTGSPPTRRPARTGSDHRLERARRPDPGADRRRRAQGGRRSEVRDH
jgi:CheY-like chemotaxis protein